MEKPAQIQRLHRQLIKTNSHNFPETGKVNVSSSQGVYVIYDSNDEVLHVGRTTMAKGGINQRLLNHLRNQSSFSKLYMQPRKINLRVGYKFKYIEVEDSKDRAYLEALTAGLLCPAHIGTGERKNKK
jgi:hypothetical protein